MGSYEVGEGTKCSFEDGTGWILQGVQENIEKL